MQELTQKELKEILNYDPNTGLFVWVKTIGPTAKKGEIAGCKTGKRYMVIRVNKSLYYAHRLAFLYMTGSWPSADTDHEDGNRFNNKWENLRDVTRQVNLQNSALSQGNTSGCTGVVFYKRDRVWQAQIMILGKNIFLGRFPKKHEAVIARKRAEILYRFHPNHGRIAPVS